MDATNDTWSDNDELICPYCGYHYKIDHTEFALSGEELEFDDRKFTCPNCENEYLVSRRVHFTYKTYKSFDEYKNNEDYSPKEGSPEYYKLAEEAWNNLSPEQREALEKCKCEAGAWIEEMENDFHPCLEYPD